MSKNQTPTTNFTAEKASANNFINFLNNSPSPWHAVHEIEKILKHFGFNELKEASSAPWKLNKGGLYYIKRHGSTLRGFLKVGFF